MISHYKFRKVCGLQENNMVFVEVEQPNSMNFPNEKYFPAKKKRYNAEFCWS